MILIMYKHIQNLKNSDILEGTRELTWNYITDLSNDLI